MKRPVPAAANAELVTERLVLRPITEADAKDLFAVLKDPRLYEQTSDDPPSSIDALRRRYRRLSERLSPDDSELWLNWSVRLRKDRRAIGYVQATVRAADAELAWVIGTPWQGRGHAKEAAKQMVDWLRDEFQVHTFTACIRPGHAASEAVAASVGLQPTDGRIEGETMWTLTLS
jgi:RimJ/RimL family protein N-acetyltransferase